MFLKFSSTFETVSGSVLASPSCLAWEGIRLGTSNNSSSEPLVELFGIDNNLELENFLVCEKQF